MGGLLSHMMAIKSEDKLWRLYSDRAFDTEIIGPRDVLDELRTYLFFDPLPFVKRVVFLATPHRGSDMARGVVGRVGTNLIADPDHIHDLLRRLVKDNPDAFDSRRFRRFPTSIETLDTDSPMLMSLLKMKPRPGVSFHSIIGSIRPTGVMESTDGVVPWRSSHLEGVPEKMVRSDHGVQKDPEAIIEVRNILLEHLGIAPPGPGAQEARGPARTGRDAALMRWARMTSVRSGATRAAELARPTPRRVPADVRPSNLVQARMRRAPTIPGAATIAPKPINRE